MKIYRKIYFKKIKQQIIIRSDNNCDLAAIIDFLIPNECVPFYWSIIIIIIEKEFNLINKSVTII